MLLKSLTRETNSKENQVKMNKLSLHFIKNCLNILHACTFMFVQKCEGKPASGEIVERLWRGGGVAIILVTKLKIS